MMVTGASMVPRKPLRTTHQTKDTPATKGTLRCTGTKEKLNSWAGTQIIQSAFRFSNMSLEHLESEEETVLPSMAPRSV